MGEYFRYLGGVGWGVKSQVGRHGTDTIAAGTEKSTGGWLCPPQMYQCPYCKYSNADVNRLRVHAMTQHSVQPMLRCPLCQDMLNNKIHLQLHLTHLHSVAPDCVEKLIMTVRRPGAAPLLSPGVKGGTMTWTGCCAAGRQSQDRAGNVKDGPVTTVNLSLSMMVTQKALCFSASLIILSPPNAEAWGELTARCYSGSPGLY